LLTGYDFSVAGWFHTPEEKLGKENEDRLSCLYKGN
jgi:hypothetical protein